PPTCCCRKEARRRSTQVLSAHWALSRFIAVRAGGIGWPTFGLSCAEETDSVPGALQNHFTRPTSGLDEPQGHRTSFLAAAPPDTIPLCHVARGKVGAMKRLCFGWAWGTAVLACCLAGGATGKERVERFDKDPGWEGHNNRSTVPEKRTVRQDFGYSK